jgi:spore photoproduct lyase
LNPPAVIREEEPFAAGLEERLAAARRAREAGYSLAFHFDPIIRVPGWEKAYEETVFRLASLGGGEDDRIAWISLGTMRYPGELKDRLGERPYLFGEYVRSRDGKFRYLQPVRWKMYASMVTWIRAVTRAPLYLCMESPAVWKKVFGNLPAKMDSLCAIFNTVTGGDSNASTS